MTAFDSALGYIRDTVGMMPADTLTRFEIGSAVFVDADRMGGARIEIELMAGQSRVFEVGVEQGESSVVRLGQAVPSSYTHRLPVRVRYDGGGVHATGGIQAEVKRDQLAIVDALHRNNWSAVTGLVHLTADPGAISSFTLTDDTGREHVGYIGETVVTFSHDI